MDPVVALMAGAVAALFLAYTAVQQLRIAKMEKEGDKKDAQIAALEEENKEYVSMFVLLQAGDTEDLQRVRETVARILRGDKGYGK